MTKNFLVAWVIAHRDPTTFVETLTTDYQVYTDSEDRNTNFREAQRKYDDLLGEKGLEKNERVYTLNLCEIMDSTDY
jgi:hypothetical protein